MNLFHLTVMISLCSINNWTCSRGFRLTAWATPRALARPVRPAVFPALLNLIAIPGGKMNLFHLTVMISLCSIVGICLMNPRHCVAQSMHPQTSNMSDNNFPRARNHARAGCPLLLSKHAAHTYGDRYQGYYVGGGVPTGRSRSHGERRHCDEGTWGVDYAPWYSRVAMKWSHGHLFQGGTGQYEPDHKNRPFGQTYGEHFGNRDRRFAEHEE